MGTFVHQVAESVSLQLFKQLLRIRLIEEAIGERYPEQKMRCPVHLSIGQEAIAVGVCQSLQKTDYLVSNHRAHAHYLAKGGDLKRMLAEIYGKIDGCTSGIGGSMHLIDRSANIIGTTPIVGGSLPVGVGVAFASLLKEEDRIMALFFGEGSTEEGVWSECINFAALWKLPILFVCENNLYSVYSPMEVRQPDTRSRIAIAEAHGIYSLHGDGNEVETVYEVSKQAIQYIREKKGPCFVEFDTYRYREHCGPFVDPDGYRPAEEEAYWHSRCPVQLYTSYLTKQQILSPSLIDQFKEEIIAEIEDAFVFAENSPFPTYNLEDYVYG